MIMLSSPPSGVVFGSLLLGLLFGGLEGLSHLRLSAVKVQAEVWNRLPPTSIILGRAVTAYVPRDLLAVNNDHEDVFFCFFSRSLIETE
jgi:hypothetical protein